MASTIPLYERVTVYFEKGYRSLRALKDFHQGEIIVELPQATLNGPDQYSLEVLPGIHIDCSFSPAGAINHSCAPNSAVRRNYIVAWTCIKTGEEITLDYKRTEHKLASPFDCSCGAKNCRGRME